MPMPCSGPCMSEFGEYTLCIWFTSALFANSFKLGQLRQCAPQPPTAAFWKFYKVENKEE